MAWKKIIFSGSSAQLSDLNIDNAITASGYSGDGSGLTNLTVAQVATVSSTFTNETSVTVNHNFDSKNVQIQVFNDSDELIIPATVTLTDTDNVTITFDSSTSGHAVVAKGGHIVSGSTEFDNIANKPTLLSGSAEGDAQGQIKLNGVNVNVNDLGTNDSPTFTNLTLSGNLTVQGTTTTVDSTTLDIGDNIIALNGTGATLGGIHVNDGPASGSLLWDGTNNYWIAGASGSEVKLLRETGDGILSSSAQIAADISGSFTSVSASIAADIANQSQTITLAADSGDNDTYTTGETLTFSGDNSITTTVSDNEITISIANDVVSGSAQVDHDATTNFVANEHIDHSSVTIGSGRGLTGGGDITTSRSLTLDTGSNHFNDGVKTKLDAEGVISGSTFSSPSQGTVRATINGANTDVDTGLQIGDSPTFAGLTINGDLTVTGNTLEAQVSNLNVEDKFIILNSGSNSGHSGIIFGGSDPAGSGAANSGSAIFWDGDNDYFGFAQDLGSSATSGTAVSKVGNIETHATNDPSAAPTFQGKGTIYINEDSETIWMYS